MAKYNAPGVKAGKKMGGMDGARKSSKKQVSALLPANKAPKGMGTASPRMKRMAKMEKMDGPV
jgi:hypothetical protein